jgi:imidazole glycerol-phosphate synthase subunit HisF
MLERRLIPTLLVKDNSLVKTVRFKKPKYIGDPLIALKIFNEKETDEIILLDISTRANKKINFELIEEIASECFMPVAYGGGVETIADMEKLFRKGIEKIIVNSLAFYEPNIIVEAVEMFGNQSIVGAMDVKKKIFGGKNVFINCGVTNTKCRPTEYAKMLEDLGVGEIYLNCIDKEGVMEGYDLDLVNEVTSEVNVPVIAAGGAGNVDDMIAVIESGGASAAAAGSLFVYHGPHKAVLINVPNFSGNTILGRTI